MLLIKLASLPEKVVLPEPCKPAIRITAGLPSKVMSVIVPPISAASSSRTILVIIWPGFTDLRTSWPSALVFTSSVKFLATL